MSTNRTSSTARSSNATRAPHRVRAHRPEDYRAIYEWNRRSGSPMSWCASKQNEAAVMGAPLDALYWREETGWTRVRDLHIDHDFRIWFEAAVGPVEEPANKSSLLGRDLAHKGALVALNLLVQRHTAFANFEDMVTAGLFHGYKPTIQCKGAWERAALADAFDAAMQHGGNSNRAYRC